MKQWLTMAALITLILLPVLAQADPVTGTFTSTDLGGQILTGRASTWRSGVNSGLPHVLHAQSWDGANLGTQWDLSCATETSAFSVVDNRVAGNGTIVYTSTFNGGTFNFYAGGFPWGDGTGTLATTTMITTVQYMMIGSVSTPVASVINGNTSGEFSNGCLLSFAIANGNGVGETPFASIPATYPVFLDGTCGPASPSAQFGAWGNVITITMHINCTVADETTSWGAIKSLYR